MVRGSSWGSSAEACRASGRSGENPGFTDACLAPETQGFRLVPSAAEGPGAGEGKKAVDGKEQAPQDAKEGGVNNGIALVDGMEDGVIPGEPPVGILRFAGAEDQIIPEDPREDGSALQCFLGGVPWTCDRLPAAGPAS